MFVNYNIYIHSQKWRKFREIFLKINGESCSKCGLNKKRIELHHLTYKNLGRESFVNGRDVIKLCHNCHMVEEKRKTSVNCK